ncbi:hypothetical protein [Psychrobacter sp.]|uniref:hypothetical protein n=1 Tax=Psychrobacter sp. TaxID=56811 RepID=UPI002600CB37|nr:hypothetical protein [Psychrobacter sp.]
MGTWIAIAIGLFVLGSIMALKPSAIDMRLDKLRMTARRLELNPKLIACPDWIRGRNNEYGKGMIGQYSLIMDEMKFPETHYQVFDGKLKLDSHQGSVKVDKLDTSQSFNKVSQNSLTQQSIANSLNNEALTLPTYMIPLVKGVYLKANSLVVFWHDIGYVQPATNPKFSIDQIESDLLILKSVMQNWAQKLANPVE